MFHVKFKAVNILLYLDCIFDIDYNYKILILLNYVDILIYVMIFQVMFSNMYVIERLKIVSIEAEVIKLRVRPGKGWATK